MFVHFVKLLLFALFVWSLMKADEYDWETTSLEAKLKENHFSLENVQGLLEFPSFLLNKLKNSSWIIPRKSNRTE